MAIELPDGLKIRTFNLGLDVNNAVFRSDISRKLNIQAHAAGTTDQWVGTIITNNLKKDDWLDATGWIVSLKGRQGCFLVHDPDREFPSTFLPNPGPTFDDLSPTWDSTLFTFDAGEFPGDGNVSGAGQSGNSIITNNWPLSDTILKVGDVFQIETQLYMVTVNAVSNGSGVATINFEPAIRISPADGTKVKTVKAQMVARLASDVIRWESDEVAFTPVTVEFEEAI